MNRASSIQLNTINALQFFQLFRYGILLLVGVVFSKIGMPLTEIGVYEALMLLSGVICFFWLAGITNSLLSIYKESDGNTNPKSNALFTAFVLVSIFSVLGFLLIRIFSDPILQIIGHQKNLQYFKVFSWFILINSPTYLIEYIYLLKNKPKSIVVYGILSFTAQFLIVIIPAYLYNNIEYSIYGLVVLAALKFALLLHLLVRYALFQIRKDLLKLHLYSASPLIFSTLLSGSAEYIDGIIVSSYSGTAGFAIYQYGARELPFTLLLANAMSAAMIPYFSKEKVNDTLKRIREKSKQLMHILFPISMVLLLVSKYLYPLVFNLSFADSAEIFNIFLLLIISRLVFPQTLLIGIRKNKVILIASGIELIVNISCSMYLVHQIGIAGVAYGTLIAYAVEKLILIYYTSYHLQIEASRYIPIKTLFIYSGALIAVYLLTLLS